MLKYIRTTLYRMKTWMESFADKPHAIPVLAGLAFIEASVFPIPPDVLLIAIAAVSARKAFPAAFWCMIGSALGGVLGYGIGYGFMASVGNAIVEFYGAQRHWDHVVTAYQGDFGVWFLAISAFTPIPYKVATIAAGATQMSFVPFLLISAIGRGARFFLVAALMYYFGARIRAFIERYFDKLSILFVILLVGGFAALKFIR